MEQKIIDGVEIEKETDNYIDDENDANDLEKDDSVKAEFSEEVTKEVNEIVDAAIEEDSQKEVADVQQSSSKVLKNQAPADLESTVKNYIEQYKNFKFKKYNDCQSYNAEIQSLIKRYLESADSKDVISTTKLAERRIRLGELFNIEKKLLKKQRIKWKDHFNRCYDVKRRRSAQQWMQVAKFNDAIQYAPLGIDKLLKLIRKIKGNPSSANPITDLLQADNLEINFDDVKSIEEAKNKVNTFLTPPRPPKDASIEKQLPKLASSLQKTNEYLLQHPEEIVKIRVEDIDLIKTQVEILRQTKLDNLK
jgi:hypothetical protein